MGNPVSKLSLSCLREASLPIGFIDGWLGWGLFEGAAVVDDTGRGGWFGLFLFSVCLAKYVVESPVRFGCGTSACRLDALIGRDDGGDTRNRGPG